jgi:hypothetical protein
MPFRDQEVKGSNSFAPTISNLYGRSKNDGLTAIGFLYTD